MRKCRSSSIPKSQYYDFLLKEAHDKNLNTKFVLIKLKYHRFLSDIFFAFSSPFQSLCKLGSGSTEVDKVILISPLTIPRPIVFCEDNDYDYGDGLEMHDAELQIFKSKFKIL